MALQNFVDKVGPVISALWLNAVDLIKEHSSTTEYSTGTGAWLNTLGRPVQAADNTGVLDSTAALQAIFGYCIPRKLKVVLQGNYLVSAALSSNSQIAAGELHIECVGDVTITVDPAAAMIDSPLITCYTTAINSSTISGGRLTLNLNNRASSGLLVRHAGGDGGTVDFGPITVLSCTKPDINTEENAGVEVYGRYKFVRLAGTTVNGVTRIGSGGACKGISVSDIVGEVRVEGAAVSNVLKGGGSADADGLAVFGLQLNGVYGRRAGRLVVSGGTFSECQGRSIKLQVSDALIDRPVIEHQMVVTVNGNSDIDAQVGGSIVLRSPLFTYRLNGATSPIGTGFFPVSLQQQCTDMPNDMQIIDPLVRTEVTMARFAYITVSSSAKAGTNSIVGLQVQPLGALATTAFTRAAVEFDATQVASSSNTTHISVRGTRANLSGIPLIGHTGFTTGVTDVSAKFSFDAVSNENTGAVNSATSVLGVVSGNAISSMLRFMLRDSAGINDLLAITSFDYQTLPVGCRFHYNAATVTASNGPALGGAGIACVEVLGQINATAGSRSIRVVKDNANAANTVFQTQTGTWGTIK